MYRQTMKFLMYIRRYRWGDSCVIVLMHCVFWVLSSLKKMLLIIIITVNRLQLYWFELYSECVRVICILYLYRIFVLYLFIYFSTYYRDKREIQTSIRSQRERNLILSRINSELNSELQEVMEQRISLEIQLEHLKPCWHPWDVPADVPDMFLRCLIHVLMMPYYCCWSVLNVCSALMLACEAVTGHWSRFILNEVIYVYERVEIFTGRSLYITSYLVK